jgi:hypothetical protein
MIKLDYYKQININNTSKYVPKKYDTPSMIGVKWQVDVKYVPNECKSDIIPLDKRFYQYTCIDEASRERYIYHYFEQTAESTVDFVQRCIKYFGYKPKIIQTDNGMEFCFFRDVKKVKTEAAITELLVGLNYIWKLEREMTVKALFECNKNMILMGF